MVDGAAPAREDTGADRIAFLGHATVAIVVAGVRLLTDPVLRGRVAHLRRHAPPPGEELVGEPDAVLISHLHHDHLDLASLRRLGLDTRLIVPSGAGAWLARRGFTDVSELGVGESLELGALSVSAVRADHDGRRPGAPRADAVGYVASGPAAIDRAHTRSDEAATHAPRARGVYFAGDTGLFEEMAELAGSLDVALVPVAGWGAKLGPGHMNPLEAARAVALMRPRVAIPVHWGTLSPIGSSRGARARSEQAPRLFAAHVARVAPEVEVRILAPGEQTEL